MINLVNSIFRNFLSMKLVRFVLFPACRPLFVLDWSFRGWYLFLSTMNTYRLWLFLKTLVRPCHDRCLGRCFKKRLWFDFWETALRIGLVIHRWTTFSQKTLSESRSWDGLKGPLREAMGSWIVIKPLDYVLIMLLDLGCGAEQRLILLQARF